jgi:hypothetical protein
MLLNRGLLSVDRRVCTPARENCSKGVIPNVVVDLCDRSDKCTSTGHRVIDTLQLELPILLAIGTGQSRDDVARI